MSPTGALLIALSALVLLGCLAAWLLNVPILAIVVFAAISGFLISAGFRRLSKRRARQDTEA
jgi:membrane protein implicated in regulation of membrane protease activity